MPVQNLRAIIQIAFEIAFFFLDPSVRQSDLGNNMTALMVWSNKLLSHLVSKQKVVCSCSTAKKSREEVRVRWLEFDLNTEDCASHPITYTQLNGLKSLKQVHAGQLISHVQSALRKQRNGFTPYHFVWGYCANVKLVFKIIDQIL